MIFKMPHKDDLHDKEAQSLKVYNKNMLWLNWTECPVSISDGMFLNIMRVYNESGGKTKSVEKFKRHLDMFFKITFNLFVHNNYNKRKANVKESWYSPDVCLMCFVGYLESYEEALRYLYAVDKIRQYYDH